MSETSRPVVFDATREGFDREVIERSREVPVVVDFWASWCQPCRQLGPVLERLAEEYGGRFVLAKADTDQLGEVAAGFGVQGIPAVFGLRDARIVDYFVGVLPERQIRAWLDGLLPSRAEELVAEASGLDPAGAEAKYREALGLKGDLAAARIGLARALLAQGRAEEAGREVELLERRGFLEPEAEQVKAELTLGARGRASGGLEAARSEVAARPDDPTARLHLAEALATAGEHAEALEICLDLVERDRKGVGEGARQTMLAIFSLRPPDDPLAVDYRRKLSFVL